jgi:glycosyltransferase involved in cell wall biosynthesis
MLLKASSYNFNLNKNYPKITIVTPSFKQSIYIERTILSVINQNYPNLEYIIRDGLSEDGTSEIANKYKKNIYHYYSQKDMGQSNAINLGFSESSGEIMAWLNSDDLYLPHTFRKVISIFNDHPEIDVVYGHRIIIDENDQQIGRWIMPKHNSEVLSWADYIPQETLFWRRKIWNKIGKSLDEDFQFAMDWNLILKFRAAGANFFRINDYLACFRIHTAQKTSATISTVGAKEMSWLRENSLGFNPTAEEINKALGSYLKEHRKLDLLWGFLGRDKI